MEFSHGTKSRLSVACPDGHDCVWCDRKANFGTGGRGTIAARFWNSRLSGFVGPGYLPPDPRWGAPPVVVAPTPWPQSVLVSRKVIANPPLPPAQLQFVNSDREALRFTITDVKRKQTVATQDVKPQQTVSVQVPRDAGGKVVEVYQALGWDGTYQTREVVRELPVAVRYQVTVHRWQVQSIAIDRTG